MSGSVARNATDACGSASPNGGAYPVSCASSKADHAGSQPGPLTPERRVSRPVYFCHPSQVDAAKAALGSAVDVVATEPLPLNEHAMQTELPLDTEHWLNSGRDRPKGLTLTHWNYLLALIVYGGGVRFTEADMLADLHESVPHARGVTRLADLNAVYATHWCWNWEMKRPDIVREIERRRAEQAAT